MNRFKQKVEEQILVDFTSEALIKKIYYLENIDEFTKMDNTFILFHAIWSSSSIIIIKMALKELSKYSIEDINLLFFNVSF